MNNQRLIFTAGSMRAKKARMAVQLGRRAVRAGLLAVLTSCLLLGVGLMAMGQVLGGVITASLAAWPAVLLLWFTFELSNLPPAGQTLDGLLDAEVLGRLPLNPSPQAVARVVMSTGGGHFFVARFGVGPNFVMDLSSQDAADSQIIWERANALRLEVGSNTITAGMLLCALIEQLPGRDQLLAQLQLDVDDIVRGVGWQEHIKQLVVSHKVKRRTGGIGRDWAFGYTPQLDRFGLHISDSVSGGLLKRDIEGHDEVLRQLVNHMVGGGRQNAVLVGPTGVGKTTLIYGLAYKLMSQEVDVPKNLRFRQVVALDPASLIAKARGRGELESLVQELFYEAFAAKNIILFLDDAQLFLQEGTGSVDLSNLLVPVLEGGALRVILSMDEQRWLQLSQTNPGLVQYMNRVNVEPLGRDDTLLVLEDQLLMLEFRHQVTYMYQALGEAYRLGERYVPDQAMPGKAVALLTAAAQFAEGGLVTTSSVQQAVEKAYGIKVATASAADERSALLGLEDLIHQRMINQTRAVSVVANALRRARAGVRNPNRPIGTFLFLGPTGVGKSELAKSLAAAYFGGEDHLVRLDLNEFGQAADVSRLIADGAQDPHSLTAQIGKQPFSVVLLDEIEKAHPNVLNALLQLLDEGVLRDTTNRPVSFKDAIIIATSNAGADRVRQYIDTGQELEAFEQPFINELIDSGQFKPEFLNRFDEIVVFRPLKPEELLQVVDLMLAGVNKALANQKVTVQLAQDAKQLLVQKGYDPRLGARPMRRVVQRAVEDLVAKRMLAGEVAPGSVVEVTMHDVEGVL